jgi:hypothetical protein
MVADRGEAMNKKIIAIVILNFCMLNGIDVPGAADAELMQKSFELAGLEAAKVALQGQIEAAKGILKGFEEASGLAIEGTRAVLKAATSTIQINSMKAHVAPRELLEGKLPELQLEMVILGKKETLSGLVFDFKHPEDTIKNLVNKIIDTINIF